MAKRVRRKDVGRARPAQQKRARVRIGAWRAVPIVASQLAPGPWFVVAVAPRSERGFVERQDGCACEMPRSVLVPEIKRDIVVRGRRREQRLPRYPGYVLTTDLARLRGHDDVIAVLGESATQCARALPAAAIAEIVALQAMDAIEVKPLPLVRAGDRVRIGSGPFAGWLATVRRVVGDRRCDALVDLFGRATPVEFDLDAA